MDIADGVYVAKGGKLFKVHSDCRCRWSTCAFYRTGVCDGAGGDPLPCEWIDKMLRDNGLVPHNANYYEVFDDDEDDEEGEDEES